MSMSLGTMRPALPLLLTLAAVLPVVAQRPLPRLMGTEVSQDSISEQPSRQGKYVSVTVTVVLLSEEQRQAIYVAIHKEKRRILYYL